MQKTLDQKLAILAHDRYNPVFILADAKDADMAMGIAAPGQSPEMHSQEGRFRSVHEYRELIRQVTRQGLVDIMLMSASSCEVLAIRDGLFVDSAVTPAARANDTTDIHLVREGIYAQHPSRPFATATIDQIQCGKVECSSDERGRGANLGLYSMTFVNDPARDYETLTAYKQFRKDAEVRGFRHFLEVFDPNVDPKISPEKIGGFINDHIIRTLAGVPATGRPVFLKIVYHGPQSMEELCRYDESMIVGIMGGSSGTTYDAFKLLHDAKKYGARAGLFGRKINNAENQLAFVQFLRLIADDQINPVEAVRAYHGVLGKLKIAPYRSLADDLQTTVTQMSYGPPKTSVVIDGAKDSPAAERGAWPVTAGGEPDFAAMNAQQKLTYQKQRLDRMFGH
jgi:hypothetical protein